MDKEKPEFSGGDEGNNSSSATESGSESDEDSSTCDEATPWDADECERNRERCLRDLINLERQFHELKERFYRERFSYILVINVQLQQVRNGTAVEYLKKLTALEDNWRTRNEVADVLKRLQMDQLNTVYDGEFSALDQNFDNAKRILYEQMHEEIENRITKLEADKRNADINLELWLRDSNRDKIKCDEISPNERASLKRPLSPSDPDPSISQSEKRKKPMTVSGPYVVYMLKENDILEDWNIIRRAALQADYIDRSLGQVTCSL